MGTKLHFDGHMWDSGPLYGMAAACVRRTGLLRQARYAFTHLVLLFAYNVMWPDARPAGPSAGYGGL